MKYSFLLFCLLLLGCKNKEASKNDKKMTTYYLIRHAEKDRKTNTLNPHLTREGKERAERWASYFKDKEIDLIFSTDYHRTRETVRPTARLLGLGIQSYEVGNLFDASFQRQTNGKTVLIAGHQDTAPSLANKILGKQKYQMIEASNYGNLYKITVDTTGKATARLKHIK